MRRTREETRAERDDRTRRHGIVPTMPVVGSTGSAVRRPTRASRRRPPNKRQLRT